MINVALLSRWHVHADGYAQDVESNESLNITCIWDEDEERGKQWAKELDVPFVSGLDTVLADPDIDAVVVATPTNMHKEVITKAAKHSKHIFTEKVLDFTAKDSEKIYEAAEEAGVKLMVSLPMLTKPDYLHAQKVIDDGLIGDLTMVRCRFAHNGGVAPEGEKYGWLPERFYNKAQTGGGAMMDLGAHPIYLTNRLAGKAKAVSASFVMQDEDEVDSNSALLVDYESGALGIIETSFLSFGSPFQLQVYGTKGSLLVNDDKITIHSALLNDGEPTELTDQLESLPMPMEQWVSEIKDGSKPSITQEDVVNLSLMNEAAEKSQEKGRKVNLNEVNL